MSKIDDDRCEHLLTSVMEYYEKEDRTVRERQIRTWRRLKFYWEGFQQVWWSDTAHDWRVYDAQLIAESSSDQSYYDKPVNIFRAYLESIIAALSITIPGVICYPDDATNDNDTRTAQVGNRIGKLIAKHNNVSILWLHTLFIWATEGMVAGYTYTDEDEKYGTYEKDEYKDEEVDARVCPTCGTQLDDQLFAQSKQLDNRELDEFNPDDEDAPLHDLLINKQEIVCPQCAAQLDPDLATNKIIVTRFVGRTKHPKSRQCMEAYGGLYVKIPNYAHTQSECPYLILANEFHYSKIMACYPDLNKTNLAGNPNTGSMFEPYERWGRLSPQYGGEYPQDLVTLRKAWFRPWAFNILPKEDADFLKKKFPDGCKAVFANAQFAEACNESLDDHWEITPYPLSDYLHHDPLGMALVNIQDMTNELVSLILQTIEHGIPQTFADPAILNFNQYAQQEATPGMIIPTKSPRTGQRVADGFFETRTATLSGEVLPFGQKLQEFGQLTSGALPSLFGGALEGTKTASEYSMSRSQALQRLQNNWKVLLVWWKSIFGKSINGFIEEITEDEKFVERDEQGNFYNVFIRRSELSGKIGNIELEANENLPVTWSQRRDIVMQFLQAANPAIMTILSDPNNIDLIREAIGLDDLEIPGQDDRDKQFEEIQLLVGSAPIEGPQGEMPSVQIDPDVDNHKIQSDICRTWLISEAGRQTKLDNPEGYRNVLLHMKQHLDILQQNQMQQMQMQMQQQQQSTNKPQNDKVAAQPPTQTPGAM